MKTQKEVKEYLKSKRFDSEEELYLCMESSFKEYPEINYDDYSRLDGETSKEKASILWEEWIQEEVKRAIDNIKK